MYNNQTNFEPADLAEGYTLLMEKLDEFKSRYKRRMNCLFIESNAISDMAIKNKKLAEMNVYRQVAGDISELDTLEQWIGQTINTERKKQVEHKAEDAKKDKALKVIAGILENHTTFGNITDAEFREAKELLETIKL